MSHTYGNGNSNGTSYLGKKRPEEDIPIDNRYHYDKYEKFDKYGNHGRYNNMSYIHSKPSNGNSYYGNSSRYRGSYYNTPKSFHGNSYSNKGGPKRDYKKPYQKYTNEGIRNLSHCEMPSPPPLSLKPKSDSDSLKNISSTSGDSKSIRSLGSNTSLNIKDINKFVSNITNIPTGRGQPIFNQQSINIGIKLGSPSNLKFKEKGEFKEENKKRRKDEDNKEEEIPIFTFPKPSEKLLNYQPFNKSLIKIESNPLDDFGVYPKKLFELNKNNFPRKSNSTTIRESINNDNLENALSIKSCYLLAKIPNWNLVTKFIPASLLTKEKFKNIISLDEEKDDDSPTEDLNSSKNVQDNGVKKEKEKKFYLVYSEKYEENVEKTLDPIMQKKKQVKRDIFNKRYIIAQYHNDILKFKNKLKQNKYKINYLNIKQENLKTALEGGKE